MSEFGLNDPYFSRIVRIHRRLGITSDYASRYGLSLVPEAVDLVAIGLDIFGRRQELSREAADSWRQMREGARRDGFSLRIVSGFRSVSYQQSIIQRKLDRGESIHSILKINAAPGYSEHHTGRAVDVTVEGCEALTESFARSEAFEWLVEHAASFGFRMSYPKGNRHGIAYEPWHWFFARS